MGANLGQEFIEATPSAELLPLSAGVQDDEADSEMGMVCNTILSFVLWQFFGSVGTIWVQSLSSYGTVS
jgi:NAD+ synthase (glutamine-hydrolysing)